MEGPVRMGLGLGAVAPIVMGKQNHLFQWRWKIRSIFSNGNGVLGRSCSNTDGGLGACRSYSDEVGTRFQYWWEINSTIPTLMGIWELPAPILMEDCRPTVPMTIGALGSCYSNYDEESNVTSPLVLTVDWETWKIRPRIFVIAHLEETRDWDIGFWTDNFRFRSWSQNIG